MCIRDSNIADEIRKEKNTRSEGKSEGEEAPKKKNLAFVIRPQNSKNSSRIPVSYTHLDVYKRQPFTLQRYKGLGEMDAEQLWETTLDPKRRLLKLVEIEDARMASGVTEMLMGTEVPPRRAFIYENATEAELDI